jgi:hypothetical protein
MVVEDDAQNTFDMMSYKRRTNLGEDGLRSPRGIKLIFCFRIVVFYLGVALCCSQNGVRSITLIIEE